jgi:hypothetical protein
VTETEDLPLTAYARAQDKAPGNGVPIGVRVLRQGLFALGVGLFVYGLGALIMWMSTKSSYDSPAVTTGWGAALISLALPLPRRWV